MARIMLINPPWYVLLGMSSSSIPLGLTSLAGSLMKNGHEVAVFNADLHGSLYASDLDVLKSEEKYVSRLLAERGSVWQGIRERLRAWNPDLIGVHVKTPSWQSGQRVAKIAKEALPAVLTVCGGPHVSCAPEEIGPESGFDYAIIGEGELSMKRFLEARSDEERQKIPGVVDLSRSSPSSFQGPSLIEDLDELPFDGRRALLDIEMYDRLGLGAMMTARGCPFACEYCASRKTWTRKVRYRSAENVVAEIDHLVEKYKVRYLDFCDDTFTLNKERAHEICDVLRRRYRTLRWKCTTRADCIDAELAGKLRASGCAEISVGIESGSPRILELIRKGETREGIEEGCRILRESRIPFVAFIMIGFPSETEEEALETLDFAKSLEADSLCGSVVTPYPGTGLHAWAREAGKLAENEDWSRYYHQSAGMGLWDIPSERARDVTRAWFEGIEAYNHRAGRLIKRFASKFRSDPVGTIRRSASVIWSGLS